MPNTRSRVAITASPGAACWPPNPTSLRRLCRPAFAFAPPTANKLNNCNNGRRYVSGLRSTDISFSYGDGDLNFTIRTSVRPTASTLARVPVQYTPSLRPVQARLQPLCPRQVQVLVRVSVAVPPVRARTESRAVVVWSPSTGLSTAAFRRRSIKHVRLRYPYTSIYVPRLVSATVSPAIIVVTVLRLACPPCLPLMSLST